MSNGDSGCPRQLIRIASHAHADMFSASSLGFVLAFAQIGHNVVFTSFERDLLCKSSSRCHLRSLSKALPNGRVRRCPCAFRGVHRSSVFRGGRLHVFLGDLLHAAGGSRHCSATGDESSQFCSGAAGSSGDSRFPIAGLCPESTDVAPPYQGFSQDELGSDM